MSEHRIVTVGISLLSNYARACNLSLEDALKQHRGMGEFLREDPCKASAELNSLNSRTAVLNGENKGLAVTLVFTTTGMGKAVASLLERELKTREVKVHRLPVRGVDAPPRDLAPEFAAREAVRALTDLRQRVVDHIVRLQRTVPPRAIQLNCTGGYKAECAVLYELGRALRLSVYYLHETFKVAVELP